MLAAIIAQISDLHVGTPGERLFGRVDTAACLRRCVESLMELPVRPDALVVSGDLVNTGSTVEYALLRELLAPLLLPVYPIPGNHDERSALRAAFGDHAYLPAQGELCYTVQVKGLRLIMLDSVVPGTDGGALGAHQLEWLERTLASSPYCPSMIFVHHPTCETGIPYMDRIALASEDAARLGALIDRYPIVHRVCCGHVHRSVLMNWRGTAVAVCPSSAFQYVADPREDAEPVITGEQPAYQLHLWNGARLATHTVQVRDAH